MINVRVSYVTTQIDKFRYIYLLFIYIFIKDVLTDWFIIMNVVH